jgi:deazaflavin-dependent oxidoreductase (nitroreductase family)
MGRILRLTGRITRLAMLLGIVIVLARLLRRASGRQRGRMGELPPWRGPAWFRHFVTYRFDPLVMGLGLVGGRRSPWAMIEHVGRRTGTVRRTPILPHVVGDHVLVPLPYGRAAHWVRNIQASGHCRMQLHERVYELDEPQVLAPDAVAELPAWQRESALQGPYEFLRLRIFRTLPGTLESVPADASGVTPEQRPVSLA